MMVAGMVGRGDDRGPLGGIGTCRFLGRGGACDRGGRDSSAGGGAAVVARPPGLVVARVGASGEPVAWLPAVEGGVGPEPPRTRDIG